MRILLIHQYFLEKNEAGGSRFNEMTKIWSQNGHNVTVICGMVHYSKGVKRSKYKEKFIHIEKEFYRNVDVVRCHSSNLYNINFLGRFWSYISFIFSSIYAALFKIENNYDIIICSSPPLFDGISAYMISKIKKIKYVFEIRDLWPESAIDTGIVKNRILIKLAYILERFIYRNAKFISVLTPAFKKSLIQKKNICPSKIFVIPNGCDFSISKRIFNSFNADSFKEKMGFKNSFLITYVGAHGVANNLSQLFDVAEKLKNKNLKFLLVGDGMKKNSLINTVKERNLNNIIFFDSVPKDLIFKYIMMSDVGLSILAKNDTFKTIYSNKTFDYMLCKKPVLMVIEGISMKLVNDAKCGICAEPENTTSIINAVNRFLSMKSSDLEQMGKNGYKYANKNFDRLKLAKSYIKNIEEYE